MKIRVNVHEMQEAIKKGGQLLPKKSSLPIIENVLITASAAGIKMLITDLESFLEFNIPGTVQEEGKTLLDNDTLKLISKLKNLSQMELTQSNITAGNKSIKCKNGYDPELFPMMDKEFTQKAFTVSQPELLNLLEIKYAAGHDELSSVFNGICIDKNHFVCTDTHRLAKREFTFTNNLEKPVIFTLKAVNILYSLLDKKAITDLTCFTEERNNFIRFAFDNVTLISRLVDGVFPNWKAVWPNDYKTEININVQKAIEELTFIKDIVKEHNGHITFAVDNKNLYVDAENSNNGITLTIPAKVTGELIECMGINYNYLIDVLQHNNEKEITLKLSGTLSPIIIDNDLVLPIRGDGKRLNAA